MMITTCMVMAVDVLLLYASGQIVGIRSGPFRILAGALIGGMMAGLSLIPCFGRCSHILWRILGLIITSLVTFGFCRPFLPATLLFLLLHLSVGNLTGSRNEMFSTLLGAAGMVLACILVKNRSQLVDVSLTYEGRTSHFAALRDTGNELRDPVTGEKVLVVSEIVARELTGLTIPELEDPVKSITMLPGLRLIPYQTVGNSGFLLALRITDARIGNRQGSVLVAFSPRKLGHNYQGLTGGMLG